MPKEVAVQGTHIDFEAWRSQQPSVQTVPGDSAMAGPSRSLGLTVWFHLG